MTCPTLPLPASWRAFSPCISFKHCFSQSYLFSLKALGRPHLIASQQYASMLRRLRFFDRSQSKLQPAKC